VPDAAARSCVEARLRELVSAWCHPSGREQTSVLSVAAVLSVGGGLGAPAVHPQPSVTVAGSTISADEVDAFVVRLFTDEAVSLTRLARLFVDDRNAAEDLVQEAFIRLAKSATRIRDRAKAAAYLRSIVLNLARDHNRRGLVSLRHELPQTQPTAGADHDLVLREDQQEVLDALRELPLQQRNCVALRYFEELGIAGIASTLGISENSVKTHLKRGMAGLAIRLGADES
jgi:RNA polymerase sigma factor (sigma-70 family)